MRLCLRALLFLVVFILLLPAVWAQPSVSLIVTGPQSGTVYYAGDSFTLTVTGGAANALVAVNGYPMGTTGSSGYWSTSGSWPSSVIGSYTQTWYVAGVAAPPFFLQRRSRSRSNGQPRRHGPAIRHGLLGG